MQQHQASPMQQHPSTQPIQQHQASQPPASQPVQHPASQMQQQRASQPTMQSMRTSSPSFQTLESAALRPALVPQFTLGQTPTPGPHSVHPSSVRIPTQMPSVVINEVRPASIAPLAID